MQRMLHPIIEEILSKRGLNQKEREDFLFPKYENLHDPFLLKDMEKAVERIDRAIKDKEKIIVYSDYDADGVPGGVMLKKALQDGGANVFPYLPDRHSDGFGFHGEAVKKLKEEGVSLIVTVDCGIANCEAVDVANGLGIDVIITDHHESSGCVMNAFAVINPKQPDCNYPFKGLCGTGVAFKLIQALQQREVLKLAPGQEKWFLDLVAIATIADMVPLVDENRIFSHFGLLVLNKTRRSGLKALIKILKLRNIVEDDIAFLIAPRINAASRMGEVKLAYDLLDSDDDVLSTALAKELEAVNHSRKGVVASMVKEAYSRIEELGFQNNPVIVLGSINWRPSLLGLVATNLTEKYNKPVFLWGEDGSGELRGSCRGNKTVSVHDIMEKAKDAFIQYGGHKEAGGFTVSKEKIHFLMDNLCEAHSKISGGEKQEVKKYDASILFNDVTNDFLRSLFFLRPFGLDNEKPLFHFPKANVVEVKSFGKTKEHVEVLMNHGNRRGRGIKFFSSSLVDKIFTGASYDVLGHLEEDPFKGRDAWRVRIVDIS